MSSIRDDRDVERKGRHLDGKRFDLVVTGGIACIEVPKVIRELRRYGASVRVFMTPAATEFVKPLVMEWASKQKVITDLSGSAEHITDADAVVVVPATLDFISKMAVGISDSAAATLVQSALSRMPVFFLPSMHLSLQGNPAFRKNLNTLSEIQGVKILDFQESEGKAKLLDVETIAAMICHGLSSSPIEDIPVLVSVGPTRSYVDDIRYLTNFSSGELGYQIADEFYRRGAKVWAVVGTGSRAIAGYLNPTEVETNDEMREAFQKIILREKIKVGIFCAAVLDFEVEARDGKLSSSQAFSLQLKPSKKLIESIDAPSMLKVGFKLESGISVEELQSRALTTVEKYHLDFVIANRREDISEDRHRAFLWSKKTKNFIEVDSKQKIAQTLADMVLNLKF